MVKSTAHPFSLPLVGVGFTGPQQEARAGGLSCSYRELAGAGCTLMASLLTFGWLGLAVG